MREELRLAYNNNLKLVIDNGGKVDGVDVTNIAEGQDAINKISFTSHSRIYPLLNN